MSDRVELLGGPVDLVNSDQVMDFISDAVAAGRKAIVGNQNLHSLYLSRKSARMSAFFAAANLIEIDSMPLVFWGQLLGLGVARDHRCTYLDWRDRFWKRAADQGWRVFCLGAAQPANRAALARLRRQWPGVQLRGHHGYFDHCTNSLSNEAVVGEINHFRPDVILVGMGMPLQETWIIENFAALISGVVLSVGAAFDYEAGIQRAAPRVYGDLGIEWLYRFAHEPRRLFRRYMIEPWSLFAPAIRDISKLIVARGSLRPTFGDSTPDEKAEINSALVSDDLQKAA